MVESSQTVSKSAVNRTVANLTPMGNGHNTLPVTTKVDLNAMNNE